MSSLRLEDCESMRTVSAYRLSRILPGCHVATSPIPKLQDSMYIPANSIHVVENVEGVVAMAMHMPAAAPIFGDSAGDHIEESC